MRPPSCFLPRQKLTSDVRVHRVYVCWQVRTQPGCGALSGQKSCLFIPQKDTEMHTQSCLHPAVRNVQKAKAPRERRESSGKEADGQEPGNEAQRALGTAGSTALVRKPKMNECFVIRYRFIHGFHHRHLNLGI